MKALLIQLSGRVCGVGFRSYIQHRATELGVTGLARNVSRRCMSLHAQGSPEQLYALLAACAQGPRGARVDSVTVHSVSVQPFDDFVIIT